MLAVMSLTCYNKEIIDWGNEKKERCYEREVIYHTGK